LHKIDVSFATDGIAWSFCLCACMCVSSLLITFVSPARPKRSRCRLGSWLAWTQGIHVLDEIKGEWQFWGLSAPFKSTDWQYLLRCSQQQASFNRQ